MLLLVLLVGKVLSKAFRKKTRAIIIIPNWPSQHWYPLVLSLATAVLEIKPQESNFVWHTDHWQCIL